tara:strand:+ start:297 stop:497 length:201 start_codon:yes stop_codon:yes gene_type:complete
MPDRENIVQRSMVFHDLAVAVERLIELGVKPEKLISSFKSELDSAVDRRSTICPTCGQRWLKEEER